MTAPTPGAGQPPNRFTTRAELAADQLAKVNRLLATVLPTNRFYAARWSHAGLPPQISSFDEFSRHVPFTHKADLVADQADHPPYGTNRTFPLSQYTRFHQTSASTGTPLRWLDTPSGWQWMLDNWHQVLATAGVSARDRILFAFSFGPFLGFWTAFEAAAQAGCLCLPGGGLSTAARLKLIADNAVTVLCCTPTYALRLHEVARAENLLAAADTVRCLIVAGEPGGLIPETRARIAAAWPAAQIFDHHGMTETGPVSVQTAPDVLRLRVFESAYLAEIIDPVTTQPVAVGGIGELVLTTLGREGSPLIRYRTGDLVAPVYLPVADHPLPVLQLDGGIQGRMDDMAIVRGVNVYPAAIESLVRQLPAILEYRVTLLRRGALTEMKIEIEPTPTADVDTLARKLEQALKAALNLRIPVTVVAPGRLPRFELKAKRWIVENPDAPPSPAAPPGSDG